MARRLERLLLVLLFAGGGHTYRCLQDVGKGREQERKLRALP